MISHLSWKQQHQHNNETLTKNSYLKLPNFASQKSFTSNFPVLLSSHSRMIRIILLMVSPKQSQSYSFSWQLLHSSIHKVLYLQVLSSRTTAS